MSNVRDQLSQTLGSSYVIERELTGGGMATVFVAMETVLGRRVVIKVLGGDRAIGMSAERVAREVRLAAQLQHPQIVPVLATGETAGQPYYIMPFVQGESLRARLVSEGALPIPLCVSVLRDTLKALEHAHAHGVIHRDIKPDNVLLSGSSASVTDFGIAKAISESREPTADAGTATPLTQIGASLGTPAYMSPEQAAGDEVDHRADLYSWGVMAYEMLSGAHLFPHRKTATQILAAQLTERPAALREKRADCPPALADLVMRCVEKSTADRPQSASDILASLDAMAATAPKKSLKEHLRGPRGAIAVVLVLVVASTGMFTVHRSRIAWAHGAVAEIGRLSDAGEDEQAFVLATRALAILPKDSAVVQAARRVTRYLSFTSTPVGARVFKQALDSPDSSWTEMGKTPFDSLPAARVVLRLRFEMEGYRPYYALSSGRLDARLVSVQQDVNDEMVFVSRGRADFRSMPGLGYLPIRMIDAFEMGRYEVTNREFKRFVDAGGYSKPGYWSRDIKLNGKPTVWADAVATFTDRTGRPGPALWEVGDYPKEQADYPVTGISWFEADAYARFLGKQLPTAYHWVRAASTQISGSIIPYSNSEGNALAPVGKFRGMSSFGAFDVAGNAREWVSNASGGDRYLLGGAFNDPAYMFYLANHQDPSDRSPENGFRISSYKADSAAVLEAPLALGEHLRRFESEQPASDAMFATYKRLYDYDPTPLDARIERTDTLETWIRQRVTFAAAYGTNERVIAYVYLPRSGKPPYQTMLAFPGAGAIGNTENEPPISGSSFLKSGRALIQPIYKSTYERRDALEPGNWYPNATNYYRDHVTMWAKDLRRSMDYLWTRTDIDTTRVAYSGGSWGGYQGGIMLAIEPRFKAAVLQCPGLAFERPLPEVDQVNFLSRIKLPVLMISGRYDAIFPLETSAQPMMRLIGTPAENKRLVVVDAGHCPPGQIFTREALSWLDKYLGPVR